MPGYAQLVRELLILTYQDLHNRQRRGGRHFQHRQEALAFLHTEWFEYLCASIDLDPDYVRKRFIGNGFYADKRRPPASRWSERA